MLRQRKTFWFPYFVLVGLSYLVCPTLAQSSTEKPEFWTNTQYYLGIIWLAAFIPTWVIGSFLYYHNRDQQPIRAHSPSLVLLCSLTICAYGILICLRGIFANEYPCYLSFWSDFVCQLALANLYLLRAWVLYFRHSQTNEMIRVTNSTGVRVSITSQNESEHLAKPSTWFHDHRYLNSRSFLTYLALSCFFPLSGPSCISCSNHTRAFGARLVLSTRLI